MAVPGGGGWGGCLPRGWGCLPRGKGSLPRGVSAYEGVYPGGVCLEGVCLGGDVCLVEVSALGVTFLVPLL